MNKTLKDHYNNGTTRQPYPYERCRTQLTLSTESITDQASAQEKDVNLIVQKYKRTGILPPVLDPGKFADVTGLQGDLTEGLIAARSATEMLKEEISRRNAQLEDEPPPPIQDPAAARAAEEAGDSPGVTEPI